MVRSARLAVSTHDSDYCSPKKLQRRETVAFGPIPKKCLGFAEEMAVGTLEQPSQIFY